MSNIVDIQDGASAQAARERERETALLERVRDHADSTAFASIFALFTPRLQAWFCAQGYDAAAAEGVVQDVMVTVWTRARSFDHSKASARTWIYTLARNRMIDVHRAGSRRQRAHDEFATHVALDEAASDSSEADVNRAHAVSLLETLPEDQRSILLLAYVEGRSQRDIASELAIPLGTVKSRTRLALRKLRSLMEETQ